MGQMKKHLSRREFFQVSGAAVAGSFLAACNWARRTESTPTAPATATLAPTETPLPPTETPKPPETFDEKMVREGLKNLAGARYPNLNFEIGPEESFQVILTKEQSPKPIIVEAFENGKPDKSKQFAFATVPLVYNSGENKGKTYSQMLAMVERNKTTNQLNSVVLRPAGSNRDASGANVIDCDELESNDGVLASKQDKVSISITMLTDPSKIAELDLGLQNGNSGNKINLQRPDGNKLYLGDLPYSLINQFILYSGGS